MSSNQRPLKRTVTFKSSAFNTSEPKDYFVNPGCFGDDVAIWLIQELQTRGYEVDNTPGQEDFGWYLRFCVPGSDYFFLIAYRPSNGAEQGTWIGCLERNCGLLARILGGSKRGITSDVRRSIHGVLCNSSRISDIRWHYEHDFNLGREDLGTENPES